MSFSVSAEKAQEYRSSRKAFFSRKNYYAGKRKNRSFFMPEENRNLGYRAGQAGSCSGFDVGLVWLCTRR